MTRKDDEAVEPGGVPQLSTSKQHLVGLKGDGLFSSRALHL